MKVELSGFHAHLVLRVIDARHHNTEDVADFWFRRKGVYLVGWNQRFKPLVDLDHHAGFTDS